MPAAGTRRGRTRPEAEPLGVVGPAAEPLGVVGPAASRPRSGGPAPRRALAVLLVAAALPAAARQGGRLAPVEPESAAGAALLERLRRGGLVLFFRHADTRGEPCDRTFRVGDRDGQRNISPAGRAQAARIGGRLRELGVPIAPPVLAGPVHRARDTAEHAFGAAAVAVTDSLLADDFSGPRLAWVLAEHRRLFGEPVPGGANRALVGHRTPAVMVAGEAAVGDRAFPEGTALVIEPRGGGGFSVLGVLAFAPLVGDGFHGC